MPEKVSQEDLRHMRHALRLAARALGTTAPNPAVGCIIVSPDGHIAGRGWTQPGGRPHAETVALSQADTAARGGTAYVTLEPCSHHGTTPPCADALIAAGISRVIGAIVDPDPRVSGQGFAKLENAGIAVSRGVLETEARALNLGFFKRVTEGRPFVALKIAQSADGFVADVGGNSKWITSEPARRHGHLLRAQHDAIMVGIGTVIADDPALTCRLPGLEHRSPLRIVLDSRLRLPPASKLARTARDVPVILFTTTRTGGEALKDAGVEIVPVGTDENARPDLAAVLLALGERGVTRVLAEGGPTIQTMLLDRGFADRLYLYRAPILMSAGRKAVDPFASTIGSATKLKLLSRQNIGPDVLESYAVTV